VRVYTFALNRAGHKDCDADFALNNLKSVYKKCEDLDVRLLFIDADNCLYDSCVNGNKPYKSESKKNFLANKFSFRLLYAMSILSADMFYSHVGARSRFLYPKSEDNLKWFLENITKRCYCVISTYSCFKGIKNIVKECGANVNVIKPIFKIGSK
jgi:hypothetical protein